MKQGSNSRRPRGGRPGGRRPFNSNSSSHNRTLESNGPNVKLRGTVSQLCEKYQTMARDAVASGNRVSAENYYQHAEHYLRVMNGTPRPNPQPNAQPQQEGQTSESPGSEQPSQSRWPPQAEAAPVAGEAPAARTEPAAPVEPTSAPVKPESARVKPESAIEEPGAAPEGGEPEPPVN